ncbi:MAG: hypothetical protein IKN34_10075, partial [Treponema sp.]|nr:hypothetical protein [Treponema sp.]
ENIHGWNIRSIITDLDDPKVYGGAIWNGFKNGRARLSILSKAMISDSGKLMILKESRESPFRQPDTYPSA